MYVIYGSFHIFIPSIFLKSVSEFFHTHFSDFFTDNDLLRIVKSFFFFSSTFGTTTIHMQVPWLHILDLHSSPTVVLQYLYYITLIVPLFFNSSHQSLQSLLLLQLSSQFVNRKKGEAIWIDSPPQTRFILNLNIHQFL